MGKAKNHIDNVYLTLDYALVRINPDPNSLQAGIASGKYKQEIDGLHKFCNRCNEYWPADSEFFFSDKKSIDGFYGFCKACYTEKRYPNGRNNLYARQPGKTKNSIVDKRA